MKNKFSFQSKIHYLYQRVLTRTVPHTVVSWRFFLPRQSTSIQLHRRIFFQAWSILPKIFWLPITLYSLIIWYCFFAWYYSLRSWWLNRNNSNIRKSAIIQLFDLSRLALIHGIPPGNYYQYKLYNYPTKNWFDFIFTHELPHWHHTLSLKNASLCNSLLSDKNRFSEIISAAGIKCLATQCYLKREDNLPSTVLFKEEDLFIKPNMGSSAIGCLLLTYSRSKKQYQLKEFLTGHTLAKGQEQIEVEIRRRQKNQDLIVQKKLQNHSKLQGLLKSQSAVTIRLITGKQNENYKTLMAVLEIPLATKIGNYLILRINCENGALEPFTQELSENKNSHSAEVTKIASNFKYLTLPFWKEACDLCTKAHQQFSNILTIGWDITLTPHGPVLIEGNANWGVAVHQMNGAPPALQGPLKKIYTNGRKI